MILANALIFGVLACAAGLWFYDPDLYRLSVEEDGLVEWGSFWAFLLAGITYLLLGWQRRQTWRLAWFPLGVGIFCMVVALEEISWGQRIFGYRPPQYFLANNFQQELNLHNVVATDYRKIALQAVILGFGVLLPGLAIFPHAARLLDRCGIDAPPIPLAPTFLVTWIFYLWYPWTHSGEWVELMLGLAFLFAGLCALTSLLPQMPRWFRSSGLAGTLLAAWLVVLVSGSVSAVASGRQRGETDPRLSVADIEIQALQRDFLAGRMLARCGVHKRLYTYILKYDQNHLLQGKFAALTSQHLPEERAAYFLDPWNSPYWIKDNCAGSGRDRTAFVYSFGPNRRRESDDYAINGDDVGLYILQ